MSQKRRNDQGKIINAARRSTINARMKAPDLQNLRNKLEEDVVSDTSSMKKLKAERKKRQKEIRKR